MIRRLFVVSTLVLPLMVGGAFVLPTAYGAEDAKSDQPDTQKDISQSVVQSFSTDTPIQTGMIVRIADKEKSSIQPAEQRSSESILGVTIAANESPVTITQVETDKSQVFVANSGRFKVLVSNQNGPIKAGDYIVISAIDGIGMKADDKQAIVVGTATTDFSGTSNVVGTVKLKDSSGSSKDVSLGRVVVTVSINKNPLNKGDASDFVPGFLAQTVQTVSGKPVSAARIYLGVVILLAAAFVAGVVLYSGVKSGMIAVGRNPLSRKSIFRSLFQTVIAGLTIFIVGVFAVYLLLKL